MNFVSVVWTLHVPHNSFDATIHINGIVNLNEAILYDGYKRNHVLTANYVDFRFNDKYTIQYNTSKIFISRKEKRQ